MKMETVEVGVTAGGKARTTNGELLEVAPGRIGASGTNPRKSFPKEAQEELMESIRTRGVIQPLIVRRRTVKWELKEPDETKQGWRIMLDGKMKEGVRGPEPEAEKSARRRFEEVKEIHRPVPEFELVAGERRWRAAVALKLASVPVLVRELSDAEVEEVQVIENLQREGVSALEEAEGYRRMIESGRYTAEGLAEKIGKSRSHVFGRLKLCRLSEPVRKAVVEGKLDATAAGLIATVADAKAQGELAKMAVGGRWGDGPMSFRDLKEVVEDDYQTPLKGGWKLDDGELVKQAGACTTCPKRSGNIAGFDGAANVCTDLVCFKVKGEAWGKVCVKEAEKTGRTVIPPEVFGKARYGTFVTPTEKESFGDGLYDTASALLKKHKSELKPAIAVKEDGSATSVYKKAEVVAELKRLGAIKPKKREEKGPGEAVLLKVVARAWPLIVSAVEKQNPMAELLRMLIEEDYEYNLPAVVKRREVKGSANAWLAKLKCNELMGVLVEQQWKGPSEEVYGGKMDEGFEELCKLVGIDLKKMVKEEEGLSAKLVALEEKKKVTTKNAMGTKTRRGK